MTWSYYSQIAKRMLYFLCRFNTDKKHWVYKTCVSFEDFFKANCKKFTQKIEKFKEKAHNSHAHKTKQKEDTNAYNPIDSSNNIQVISNTEDEKIAKRIKNVFQKLSNSLNITDQQREDIIGLIVKNIVKRNKSFEQIYDDTMKFVTKNLVNESLKSHFSKKFRKLLRTIKEEQAEATKTDGKGFNIKINLNETDEKREEKDKLDIVKKEILNFIDSQKIPEVYRSIAEYPIE